MRQSKVAISLLAAVLVLSSGWWACRTLDAGITSTYQSASLEASQQALAQAFAVLKVNAEANPSKAEVIAAAQAAWPAIEPFEKDGYLWVGHLGLRFNEAGRLVEAIAGF